MKRYDAFSVSYLAEMHQRDNGEWVKVTDVLELLDNMAEKACTPCQELISIAIDEL